MTRRLNFRVSDELASQVEDIASEMHKSGVEVSISQIARKLLEEGLQRVSGKTPSNSAKGAEFERHIAGLLEDALWDAKIELVKKKVGRRTADIRTPLFDIECKTGKRPSARDAFSQVKASAADGQTPIAIIRDEGSDPFVVMELQTFLALARAVHELQIFAEELPDRLKSNVE